MQSAQFPPIRGVVRISALGGPQKGVVCVCGRCKDADRVPIGTRCVVARTAT